MIKPTVGRVVHFFDHPNGDMFAELELAAIVTYVHSDTMVNLVVFGPRGEAVGKTSVRLQQDKPLTRNEGAFCAWMPYQVGQAAKTEALEAKLRG